ncbi:allantoinase PuuE [Bradyrhizobium lablabi]|uniref:allantoinase PuuE n=1 Tax=Bradyrhizobium lablabi TaxID=722472 RepID=UPI001BA7FD33|nr:allantoinase PuuE [Bradyrhizobium lablabi]MBR1123136.1 allantoinase PuuE [Bradyrhizobium lablabi]
MSTPVGRERDYIGYGGRPPHPRWPGDARLALNFVVNYEEGSEPSIADGDSDSEGGLIDAPSPGGHDLAAESMFEYGSRVGYWRLSRILGERNLPATAMACALALERNPAAAADIVTRGWDVCAHGWRWERHAELDETTERNRIARTVESLTRAVGQRPLGWYCRYSPGPNTRRLIAEEGGFLYDSDAYNDELPYWVRVAGRPHLVVPYSLVTNDAKFIRGSIATANEYFEMLRDSFDMLYHEGEVAPRMMSVGLHLRIVGHPGRAVGLERFLDHVNRHDRVWICRRSEIARHWHDHHQPSG